MAGPSEERPGTQPLADTDEVLVASERSTDPRHATLPIDTRLLRPGTLVGRFVVEKLIGSGGMGVVYAATDPELGRRVALKLLRGERGGAGARARLLREAQAMARLSHPNVVVVYETGTFRDEVFVAMELVEGTPLSDWLAARRRPWRETLAVFMQAGRGLLAAHAAGLVHRDFKPGNVLLDAEGRARVLDFGLARAAGEDVSDTSGTLSPASLSPISGPQLTRPGDVLGTPAYMAPEQRHGGRASAHSDAYSFCVSLYEGLYGERPPGEGPLPPPPRGSDVPVALRRVLLRGLKKRPDERWPSMAALLAALEAASRPRAAPIVASAALVLLGGGLLLSARLGGGAADPCAQGHRLEGVWDPPRRAQLAAAFAATGLPYAVKTWETTGKLLDRYAGAWVEAAERACRAPGSPEARAARAACLDQRLQNLAGVVNVLAAPDEKIAARAPDAASGLDDLTVCAGATIPSEPAPSEPGLRRSVLLLRARIAAAYAAARMGKYPGTAVELGQIRDAALGLNYRPLEAEALSALAYVHFQTDDHKRAEEELYVAREAAEESRYEMLKARIWRQLAFVYSGEGRFQDGHHAAAYARAVLKTLGPEGDWERATIDQEEAYNFSGEHRNEEALALARRGLAAAERLRPADDPRLGSFINAVGYCYSELGRPDDAEPYFRRVLDLYLATSGETSGAVAKMVNNLGAAAFKRGDYAAALAHFQRALAVKEKLLAPDNLSIGYSCLNIGETLHKLGRDDEALSQLTRARDILVAKLGPDSETTAMAWQHIGEAELGRGHPADALSPLARALATRETTKAPALDLARTRFALARALWDTGGDRQRARSLAVAARGVFAADASAVPERGDLERWLASRGSR